MMAISISMFVASVLFLWAISGAFLASVLIVSTTVLAFSVLVRGIEGGYKR